MDFYSRKCSWKCRLQNGGHLVSASVCQYQQGIRFLSPHFKTKMFLVSGLAIVYFAIYWSQVLSVKGRCCWSSADRRCFNYILLRQAMLQLHLCDQQVYCPLKCVFIRGLAVSYMTEYTVKSIWYTVDTLLMCLWLSNPLCCSYSWPFFENITGISIIATVYVKSCESQAYHLEPHHDDVDRFAHCRSTKYSRVPL